MPRVRNSIRYSLSFTFALAVLVNAADAQLSDVRNRPRTTKVTPTRTSVSFELLTGPSGAAIAAQQWYRVFEKLNVSLRVRQELSTDDPGVKERVVGSTRMVTVVGQLDRNGQIVLPDRTFRLTDGRKIEEWISELNTYGAKGSPEGKALWGLDKAQFAAVYSALGEQVDAELVDKPLDQAISALQLPSKFPLRLTTTTETWLRTEFPRNQTVRQPVKGLSKGTALAIVLNDFGLGFRPLRTPDGTIELVVDPLTTTADVWSIGWEMEPLEQRKKARKLFDFVPVELEDVALVDVLHGVSIKTETPILLDRYRIAAKQIDVDSMRVSYPSGRVAWSLLLKRLLNPAKLTREVRMDEAGRAFVWVMPLEPRARN